ncbi:MAG: hypothetical protein ABFE07_28925 [Armatimonadia bacterium]
MQFLLSVMMENSAFQDQDGVRKDGTIYLRYRRRRELAKILHLLAERFEMGQLDFEPGDGAMVQDTNGNEVGDWSIHA